MADLTPYEDRDVVMCAIKLTNAGDGLSDAMAIEPAEYQIGDTIHIVIEATVRRVAYEPVKDTDVLKRVHTLRADFGMVVPESVVGKSLDKTRRAVERAKGVERLFPEDEDS